MAKLRKKTNPAQLTIRTKLASVTVFNAVATEDFIVNADDNYVGGIVRKQPRNVINNPGDPFPNDEYVVTLEGYDAGDVVEFQEIVGGRDEIGAGTFAKGTKVYGVINATSRKVTITDVETTGAAILGEVEVPLFTDSAGNKFVWVRMKGAGYTLST